MSKLTRPLFSPRKSSGSFLLFRDEKLSGVELAEREVFIGVRRVGPRGSRLKGDESSVRLERMSNSSSTTGEATTMAEEEPGDHGSAGG